MTSVAKRRWFQFCLRTLFVAVTVAGLLTGWLAWNVRWVNERQRMLEWADTNHLSYGINPSPPLVVRTGRLPITWRLLGARRIDVFIFDKHVAISDQEQLKAAFPEAIVVDYTKMFPFPPYTGPVGVVSENPR